MRRNKSSGSFRAQQEAVYDLILLQSVSEQAVCDNIKELFFNDIVYVREATVPTPRPSPPLPCPAATLNPSANT